MCRLVAVIVLLVNRVSLLLQAFMFSTVIIGRTNFDTVTEHADRNKVLDLLRLVVLTVQAPRTEEQSLQQS